MHYFFPRALFALICVMTLQIALPAQSVAADKASTVNVHNFIRAETDTYFQKAEKSGAFGKLIHRTEMTAIESQDVVRLNRDTLYSSGVFDLDAAPVSVTLPDTDGRFMSMQVLSQDHYTNEVVYAPGTYTYTKDKVGTRYVMLVIRTFANPQSASDINSANNLQKSIKVEQSNIGSFEIPKWEPKSQAQVRTSLAALAKSLGSGSSKMFGDKAHVDPVEHLIGTSIGWGGNPAEAAIYRSVYPKLNDGKTVYRLHIKDVPVDGFWSISVYDKEGFFKKNPLNIYSLNSVTAKQEADKSINIQFGDCKSSTPNCLPVMKDWNYTVRLYRPRHEITDGRWEFPEAQPDTQKK